MARSWARTLATASLCALVACGADSEEGGEVERIDADLPPEGQLNVDLASVELHVSEQDRPRLAFVTNGTASFWTIAETGARKAAEEFGVDVDVRFPGEVDLQKQAIETLVLNGIDGIAASMIDAQSQVEVVDAAAEKTNFISHDSDCPLTQRLAHVGMYNYDAGRMCGKLVKEALPDGGTVMIFVGRAAQDNARRRRQGVVDELFDREFAGFDKVTNKVQKGGKYTILGTLTDNFDRTKAKNNAEDAITRYPDLDCMVGLFAYNPPACLEAIEGMGKTEQIELVAFDEDFATLQAILDGKCHGTVVQNPYEYGYQSVKLLAALARGERDALVATKGLVNIPAQSIRKDNCQAFWDDLKSKLGDGN